MKSQLYLLTFALCLGAGTEIFGQVSNGTNTSTANPEFLGWNNGGVPKDLDITNNFSNQDINLTTTGTGDQVFITSGSTERMRLLANGNLGIGTASPAQLLDVNGNINVATDQWYGIAGNRILANEGTNNIFVGYRAGESNTGSNCVLIGKDAGRNNIGSDAVYIGGLTGVNAEGRRNVVVGYYAGHDLEEGQDNVFVGYSSGKSVTDGRSNTFVGYEAGQSVVTADANSFFGFRAGTATTGERNTFMGFRAGLENTTGVNNTIMGHCAGEYADGDTNNTFIGQLAGNDFDGTGNNDNTILGSSAFGINGSCSTGNSLTLVGNRTYACNGTTGLTNAGAIGANAKVEADNSLVLGSIDNVNGATASTNVGIGTTTPDNRLEITQGTAGQSGLRLTSLAGSTAGAPNGEVLSIDGNGDVILVRDSIGSGGIAATDLGNYCSQTQNPVSENYEIALGSAKFYFTGQEDWVENVGMGLACDEDLLAKLHVYQEKWTQEYRPHDPNNSFASYFEDNAQENTYWGVGVAGRSYGEAEWNFGGVFSATDGIDHSIGIYAEAPVDSGVNYAGFFSGDLTYTGDLFQTSDRKFKKNIEHLEGLETVMKLSPASYQFSTDKYPSIHLSNRVSYGLIAQEVEKVVPELVSTVIHPPTFGADGEIMYDEVEYKAVNYTGIIPFTVAAIQEQQTMIEEKEERIAVLEQEIERLSVVEQEVDEIKNQLALLLEQGSKPAAIDVTVGFADNGSVNQQESTELYQNRPNPFRDITTFSYSLGNAGKVELSIYSMDGVFIETVANSFQEKGDYKVEWDSREIPNGMYFYILTVDGVEWVKKAIRLR